VKNNKIVSLGLMAVLLIVLVALPGCNRIKVVPPAPQLFAPAPVTVTIAQIYADYINDAAAADAMYMGKQLWINQLVVGSYAAGTDSYLTVITSQMPAILYDSFAHYIADILVPYLTVAVNSPQQFNAGDIIEIVGTCRGFKNLELTIGIEFVNKLGAGGAVTPGQFGSY
jgi:hypothetical protein